MERSEVMKLIRNVSGVRKPAPAGAAAVSAQKGFEPKMEDDGEEYVPVGLKGVMAATEKLLALNRGLVPPDERDSYVYKRLHTNDMFLRDRIRLDADKVRRNMMYNVAKMKSLKALRPFMFDGYTEGLLVNNPLSAPLEEINPIHLVEQARRVTQMGPGGIGSDDLITDEARNVHPSQFGFVSSIEGPESGRIGVDARVAWGVKYGSDGKLYNRFFDRRIGRMRWMSPDDLDGLVIKWPE